MANKTALFGRNTPGGAFSVDDFTEHPGSIFFVDSTSSTTSTTGHSPDAPLATIDAAVALCTASKGDVIYVMPGHAEVVASAGALDLDVAGISVIGLGSGTDQPTVTLGTADTADVDIDAANITIENINFVAAIDDCAVCIDVNATDFTIRNCRFTEPTTDKNFLVCIQDAAAAASDRITVENCKAQSVDASNTHFINLAGTGKGHVIRGNVLMGTWATMCIGGAGVVTDCLIADNYILNIVATADTCINVAATAEGLIVNNRCAGGHATDGIVCGDMGSLENYYEDQDTDLSGSLEPATA